MGWWVGMGGRVMGQDGKNTPVHQAQRPLLPHIPLTGVCWALPPPRGTCHSSNRVRLGLPPCHPLSGARAPLPHMQHSPPPLPSSLATQPPPHLRLLIATLLSLRHSRSFTKHTLLQPTATPPPPNTPASHRPAPSRIICGDQHSSRLRLWLCPLSRRALPAMP